MTSLLFIALFAASIFVSPAVALFLGIAFALIFRMPYESYAKKLSKYLLQFSVVGLGFGMNLHDSLRASSDGMLFTIVSVVGVMVIGYLLGRRMGVDKKLSYLVASGTAICGGSAIAAISPVIRANTNQTSMSLAVIFTLNAIALFIFPVIGHAFGLSQEQFGTWAAIAIHDTSSVVGAGSAYGEQALMVATTIKLTRALWIIPLAIVSSFLFPTGDGGRRRISIPWFILFFVVAMILNTYLHLGSQFLDTVSLLSHRALSVTLFLIGSTLSLSAVREVGAKPILLGVMLWAIISVTALVVVTSI